jgi:parallel beta-helix repeat protein
MKPSTELSGSCSTRRLTRWPMALAAIVIAVYAPAARAATICVNPKGSHRCFETIQAAIDSVNSPNSTIVVEPGTYTASCGAAACSVASISQSASNHASLIGLTLRCGKGKVTLDATGLDHAIYIGGINQVTITGCIAENAALEGILVENASQAQIINNEVENNDSAMAATHGQGTPPCPTFLSPGVGGVIQCCPDAFAGGPGNFPEDNDDCGEGLHLRGVTSSVVQGNLVRDNIGGILLTDETGPTSGNLISDNGSQNNTRFGGDCGVTLASHIACTPGSNAATGCTLSSPVAGVFQSNGVSNNVVSANLVTGNGASGVGMFANPGAPPGAATAVYGNLISRNLVANNGQPGIAIHVHAANGNADHNSIIDNTVMRNGGDAEATGDNDGIGIEVLSNGSFGAPFSPASPIVGTNVTGNKVSGEDFDVWVGNTQTDANVLVNNLKGPDKVGVANAGTGTVSAMDNWWGCAKGPGAPGCSITSGSGTIISTPFATQPVQ